MTAAPGTAPAPSRLYADPVAKTTRNDESVTAFLAAVTDPRRRADAEAACALMAEVTGSPPVMWGGSIIGFGAYHYRYATGREGDWPAVGLSPRKQALTLYISAGFDGYQDLLDRLGPHTTGKSCLYLKRLADIDQAVLKDLVAKGFRHLDGRTVISEHQ
jgi:hypothetical protein